MLDDNAIRQLRNVFTLLEKSNAEFGMPFPEAALRFCVGVFLAEEIAWQADVPDIVEQCSQSERRYLIAETIECSDHKRESADVDRVSEEIFLKPAHLN